MTESKKENSLPTASPLHLAVSRNNYRLAENLIMRGANVNAMGHNSLLGRSNIKCSPLHIAVEMRNKAIVDLLLKYKANVNIRTSSGETALCIAIIIDNPDIIESLISAGANVNLSANNSSLLSSSLSCVRNTISDVLIGCNLIDKSESFDGFCNLFIFISISFFLFILMPFYVKNIWSYFKA